MIEWQPIETAPKNKEILLSHKNKETGRMFARIGWWDGIWWGMSIHGLVEFVDQPIYWAPINLPEIDNNPIKG